MSKSGGAVGPDEGLQRLGLGGAVASRLRLRDDLRVEQIGDELVILDVAGDSVHQVPTDSVGAVRLLQEGVLSADVPEGLSGAVASLVAAGLVDDSRQISRRAALVAGGGTAFAAAAVTTFALADPAAASTMCSMATPTGGVALTASNASYSYVTGPAGSGMSSYNLLFRAWGGGGAGGGSRFGGGKAGGGGGGGAYAQNTYAVTECTTYTFNVTVGAGGTGSDDAAGTDGGPSNVLHSSTTVVSASPGKGGGVGRAIGYGAGGAGGSTGTGTVIRAGGKGATRNTTYSSGGGGGGAGGSGAAGSDGSGPTGGSGGIATGGDGASGGNGANGVGSNDDGAAGSAPGGGGSGAGGPSDLDSDKGGNGARGEVWIGK